MLAWLLLAWKMVYAEYVLLCRRDVINVFICCGVCVRHQDVATRSRYVRLVDNVRDNGGTVR